MIPKILFSSYLCDKNDKLVTKILNKWKVLNPDFMIYYFSDEDLDIFFENTKYNDTFKKLKNGVAKADFFRICYIYEKGGFWFDLDIQPFKVKVPEKGNVNLFDSGYKNISYMFLGGIRSKLFEELIDKIMENINNYESAKGRNLLEITGPRVLQNLISEKLGKKIEDKNFGASDQSTTYLKDTEYEFEYMKFNTKRKSKIYDKLQKKYNKTHWTKDDTELLF